jgi:hypothetical protein
MPVYYENKAELDADITEHRAIAEEGRAQQDRQ